MRKYLIGQILLLFISLTLFGQTGKKSIIVSTNAIPDTICQGQYSQLSSIVHGNPGPFTYLWTPAATLSDPTISDPIATPQVNTMYYLEVTDPLYNTAIDSIMVYVEGIPPPPSPITGLADVCADTSCNYFVAEAPGAISYSWSVPAGAVIEAGQNTPTIQLQWGDHSGTVSVIIGNNCGTSVPSVLPVNVTIIPPSPVEIFGPSELCQNDTGYYYTDTIPHAINYNWKVGGDAVILQGAGTPSVMIKWGASEGNISLSGANSCGTSPTRLKTVLLDSVPASGGVISGPDTVCIGKGSYEYSIPPLLYATTYGWSLPQGSEITSGDHTNNITVEFGNNAMSGPIAAFGINDCGKGKESIKEIIAKTCTSIGENKFGNDISISPNPVNDKLFIRSGSSHGQYHIIIYSQLGELLYHTCLNWPDPEYLFAIDVTALPLGMKYIRMFNDQGSFTAKFIVY